MLRSHDAKGSLQMDMLSLGVMDLDLSISPDACGLRAFDHKKPLTRMLPGSIVLGPEVVIGTIRGDRTLMVPCCSGT